MQIRGLLRGRGVPSENQGGSKGGEGPINNTTGETDSLNSQVVSASGGLSARWYWFEKNDDYSWYRSGVSPSISRGQVSNRVSNNTS